MLRRSPPLSSVAPLRAVLLLAAGLLAAPAFAAQPEPPADTQPKPTFPEPLVRENVTQDRAVRIQEQQVRGATVSIHVQPLHGGAPYHIVPPVAAGGNDPAHLQGRAQWNLFTFK